MSDDMIVAELPGHENSLLKRHKTEKQEMGVI